MFSSTGCRNPRITLLSVLATVLLFLPLALPAWSQEDKGFAVHDPIVIKSDSDFASWNGVTGGSGTEEDPYIISGWEIGPGPDNGIFVDNSTGGIHSYFVIRDVFTHGFTNIPEGEFTPFYTLLPVRGAGIALLNIQSGGSVTDSVSTHNRFGIMIFNSTAVTVSRNVASYNDVTQDATGIIVARSVNTTISDNTVISNNYGIVVCIPPSRGNVVLGNTAVRNGIFGISLGTLTRDSKVSQNTVIGNGYGWTPYYASSDFILGPWASGAGIHLSRSTGNIISFNDADSNIGFGIVVDRGSSENLVSQNTVSRNTQGGVELHNATSNTFSANSIGFSRYGFYIRDSSGNSFNSNAMTSVEQASYAEGSQDNIFLPEGQYEELDRRISDLVGLVGSIREYLGASQQQSYIISALSLLTLAVAVVALLLAISASRRLRNP